MINRWLRHLVFSVAGRLPPSRRAYLGDDLTATIGALADDARATGGAAGERAYLCRELVEVLRNAWVAGHERDVARDGPARRLLDACRDDVRASLRQWRRRPAAAAGVVGTLGMAVAAVVTTFGLLTAVLWRPLPFPHDERLVFVWESASDERGPFRATSARFSDWERGIGAFERVAAFGAAGFSLDSRDGSVPVRGVRVTASYFETLGVRPLFGRVFDERDEAPGAPRVVLLSRAMWQGRFGGAPDIVGRDVRLGGEPYTVVGIMPDLVTPGWPSNPARVAVEAELREFWIPIARTLEFAVGTRAHVFGVVGRLRPDATAAQADAELNALRRAGDEDRHHGVTVSFREQFVRDVRAPLLVLFAASLAVLLVAGANLAALQVSRFEQRRSELATRAALGAGRVRLAGLLFVDAGLLSVAGGVAGVRLSSLALAWIPTRLPASVPFLTAPALDLEAAVFAFLAGLAVTVAISAWPALRLRTLSATPRGISLPARARVYRGLVAAQVAIGVALAVPAALLGESLSALRTRDPGFTVEGVLVVDVSIGSHAAAPLGRTARFERDVTDTISAAPGVAGVALAYDHPLESNWTQVIAMQGEVPADPWFEGDAHLRIVSPGYFEALGVRVLDGRSFEEREGSDAPGVALVNEAFAAVHGGRVLGRRFRDTAAVTAWGPVVPGEYEIVGVVANERFRGVDLPSAPAVYLSTRQFPQTSATLLVAAANDGADLPSRIRGLIRGVEPAATIGQVRSLSDILSEQLVSRRVTSGVTSVFAVAAIGLALLGLYGLMAVIVAGRTRDVGVRLALGASPVTIARTIVVESVGAAMAGIVAGIALTAVLGGFLEHLLVDVSARDPWTVMVVAGTVLAGALLAAAGPARRAARVDPVVALRSE